MRRNGAGRESDEESDLSEDYPHFKVMDTIMGGRAAVTPVHLLDSAASTSSATVEAESDNEVTTEVANKPTTSFPVVSSPSTTLGPTVCSCSSTPGPAVSSSCCPSTPAPAVIRHLSTPGSSASNRPSTPSLPDDDIPVAKNKRQRITSVKRAEKAATSLVKDVLEAQAKEQERREELEKELAAKEEEREKRADEREQKFMESMTTMMSVMSQFLGSSMMFGFPPAYMPSASPPVTAIPPPQAPLMYPYMGAPFPGPTPTTAISQVATTTAISQVATTMAPSSDTLSISTEEGDDEDS